MDPNQNEQQRQSLRDVIAQGFERADGEEQQMQDAAAAQAMAQQAEMDAGAADINAAGAQLAAQDAAQGAPQAPQGVGTAQPASNPLDALTGAQQAQVPPQPAMQGAQDGNAEMIRFLMAQLQQAQAQNQQLAAQVQQAQGTVQQQSEAAQTAIDGAMSQPSVTVPVLDFNELQYVDDETRNRMVGEWQNNLIRSVTDAVAAQYASQLAPIREDYEAKQRIADANAAKSTLYGDPRFSDFRDRDAQIEKILGSTPEISGMDADRRYLIAGLMARGLDYKPQPSAEDLVKMVQANPDAMRMLDTERARTIADRNGQIPTILPSSGLGTANAVPDNVPKSKDDLRRRIDAAFR